MIVFQLYLYLMKKKIFFFFLIAFVSHIPNTKTRSNGTETKCNQSVWHPFLTNQFHCSKIQTEIFGSVQKLYSTPTRIVNDLWHTLFMEIKNSSCNVASNSHSFILRKYFFQMWRVYFQVTHCTCIHILKAYSVHRGNNREEKLNFYDVSSQ